MAKQFIPYALRHHESVRSGLIRILNTMGRDARKLSESPEDQLEKSIHDLRTLIKRLRAYLWFLRPVLEKAFYAGSNSTLRNAARRLSKARDLHAISSALTKSAVPTAGKKHRQALVLVSRAFAQQTSQKSNRNAAPLLEEVADSVIQAISGIVWAMKGNDDEWPSPAHRVHQAFKRTRKAMKKSSHKKDPRFVHEWRKKAKKLFYVLQLTASLPKAGRIDCLKKVDDLQETLGNFQDNIVAAKHLREEPPDVDATPLKHALRLLRKNRKSLLKDARHSGKTIP